MKCKASIPYGATTKLGNDDDDDDDTFYVVTGFLLAVVFAGCYVCMTLTPRLRYTIRSRAL